jgi:hypothetical protein
VSQQEKAEQIARQQEAARMQQKKQREANQRSEHVQQNWSKLHKGLTIDEVDQLVGPLNEDAKHNYKTSLGMGALFSTSGVNSSISATFQTEAYVLMFNNGTLKSWELRQ